MNRKTPFVLSLLLFAFTAFGQTTTIDWSKIRNTPTAAGTPGYGILLPNKGFPCRFGTGSGPAQTCTLGSGLTVNATTGAVDVSAGGVGTVTSVQCGAGLTGGTITTAGVCAADFGTTAGTIAQGNDARLSNQRVPTDGSVTDAKVAAGAAISRSKLALVDDGLVGDPTLRTLGPGVQQAAQGSAVVYKGAVVGNGQTVTGPAVVGKATAGSGPIEQIPIGSAAGSVAAGDDSRFGNASALSTGTLPGGRLPASGVTAGTYGSGTGIPQVTFDSSGRAILATTVPISGGSGGAGYLLSTMAQANTAEQNRVALLSDIKAAIAAKRSLYIACGDCAVGEIEINGTTNNTTTAALGEGAKLHIVIDDSTTIMTQVGSKFMDIELAGNVIDVTPSAMDFVGGSSTFTTTVADPPFFAGRYLRLTVPDAMVNSSADPTTVFNKYDMVTLEDQTPLGQNESGTNESFQAEDFEVLETVEVAGAAADYVYISVPLKTYNLATTRLHLWKNKDTEFSVSGGRFKGDPASGDFESKTLTRNTSTSIVFDVSGIKGPVFRNIKVSDTFTGFAQIQHSMLAEFDNVQGERARNQSGPSSPDYRSLAYMADFYGANKNFRITNSGGNGWRHVFTTNTRQAGSYVSSEWPVYGETVGGHLDGYRGTFGQGGSIDTHDPSYGIRISNAIVMSPVAYADGQISPRCFSDRAANTTITNAQCYGAGNFLTMDGWRLNHYNADNVTTVNGGSMLRPAHIPEASQEDVPVFEANGRSGINERRSLVVSDFQIEDFGKWLTMAPDGGAATFDNLSFKGDIYRVGSSGRAAFSVGSNNKLTIKNTTLDFRTANVIDHNLTVNNTLIKRFGEMAGNVELTLDNVTILGCSKLDVAADHRLFANDGTGAKTIRYRNFYCDDPDVVISGGTGVTLVNLDPSTGGGGVTDGDKGDVTVSSGGTVWSVDAGAVTKVMAPSTGETLALACDSISNNNNVTTTSGNSNEAQGYGAWLNFYCGQCVETPVQYLGPTTRTGLNFGVSGSGIIDLVSALPAIIAAKPKRIIELCGTNDIKEPSANEATLKAAFNTVYQTLGDAGIQVISVPILPRIRWESLTSPQIVRAQALLNSINTYKRNYNNLTTGHKIVVADVTKYFVDPVTGTPLAGLTSDDLHPGPRGAERIGFGIWEQTQSILPPPKPMFTTITDTYNATDNPLGSLLANGLFSGTGGSPGSGTSGAIADSWGMSRSASSVTVVGSKIGALDGSTAAGQRIVSSVASATTGEPIAYVIQNVTTGFTAGDKVQLGCYVGSGQVTGTNIVGANISVRALTSGSSTLLTYQDLRPWGADRPWPTQRLTGAMKTQVMTVPATTATLQVRLELTLDATSVGSAYAEISNCELKKVP